MKDKIVVIDDENQYLNFVVANLSSDYDIIPVRNYTDVRYVLAMGGVPALFIVDLFIGNDYGFDVVDKLKEIPGLKDTPFIIMTGDYDSKIQEEAFNHGVFDFILKPVKPAVLKARVKNAISVFHMNQSLQAEVEKRTAEAMKQKEKSENLLVHVVDALIHTIEAKDYYTKGHSMRVAKYSKRLALEIGVSDEDAGEIARAGALHDIGKIAVPLEILNSPGKLTISEYEKVKAHTVAGGVILSAVKELSIAQDVAEHHHEKYNGTGYPDRLMEDEISLPARIVAIADAFDVMSSGRIYQDKISDEVAAAEIEKCAGTQFDPELAEIFVRLIREGEISSSDIRNEEENEEVK